MKGLIYPASILAASVLAAILCVGSLCLANGDVAIVEASSYVSVPEELAVYIDREPATLVIDNVLAALCIARATPTARAFLVALKARYGEAAIESASKEASEVNARLERLRAVRGDATTEMGEKAR
ncbi:hypothetical protein HS125_04490 [bacterium]|nr:hypothetical protein [bacterium]